MGKGSENGMEEKEGKGTALNSCTKEGRSYCFMKDDLVELISSVNRLMSAIIVDFKATKVAAFIANILSGITILLLVILIIMSYMK